MVPPFFFFFPAIMTIPILTSKYTAFLQPWRFGTARTVASASREGAGAARTSSSQSINSMRLPRRQQDQDWLPVLVLLPPAVATAEWGRATST